MVLGPDLACMDPESFVRIVVWGLTLTMFFFCCFFFSWLGEGGSKYHQ